MQLMPEIRLCQFRIIAQLVHGATDFDLSRPAHCRAEMCSEHPGLNRTRALRSAGCLAKHANINTQTRARAQYVQTGERSVEKLWSR